MLSSLCLSLQVVFMQARLFVNVESLSELKVQVCLQNRVELLQCQVLADSCLYWQVIHLSIACRSATFSVITDGMMSLQKTCVLLVLECNCSHKRLGVDLELSLACYNCFDTSSFSPPCP